MRYESILDTIGNTPIVKLQRLARNGIDIFVKVESFNPGGSVKDRLALAVVLDAERSGKLKPGQTIIEATSGNTGVALAMVAAARGYPFVAIMAESFSIERRKLIRAYGGKVILTPAAARGTGMVAKAKELAEKHGWFLSAQFDNPANPAWHRSTTGPEILKDFAGKRLDYFVSGWGTGGTLTGVGEVLRLARPEVQIIASEPAAAAMLSGQEWKPHKIQGWTPDLIPSVLNREVAHRILTVDDTVARDTARLLAQKEGIFTGISGGATLASAIDIANEATSGSVVLAMLPDTGERYLSTFLFEGVNEGSDDEWLESLG
ncbi:MAG: cysteine synthase A [Dokdonella sp.]